MGYLGFQGPEWSHTTESMGQRTPLLKSMYVVWWLALVACSDVVEMREYKRRFVCLIVFDLSWAKGFILCIILSYQNLYRFRLVPRAYSNNLGLCLDPIIVTCLDSRRMECTNEYIWKIKRMRLETLVVDLGLWFGLIQDPIGLSHLDSVGFGLSWIWYTIGQTTP